VWLELGTGARRVGLCGLFRRVGLRSFQLSELESPFEGDGSSAWAIPLAKPTATQVASKNAATVNRNHQ
jgi:hypothetical protein